MGCGVSKTSVTSPVTANGDVTAGDCRQTTNLSDRQAGVEEMKNQDSKEPNSLRSFSSKSIDSDVKSNSSMGDESEGAYNLSTKDEVGNGKQDPSKSSPTEEAKRGYVAFDVPLDDNQTAPLDNVLRKPLPRRLRHLEPLGNAPQITTEKLMEKLERAEEKRRRALARYKEKSSRRKERAQRRSEQMGDVIPSPQNPDDMADSDRSVTEKSDTQKSVGSAQLPTGTCDENVNWNETSPSRDQLNSPQDSQDSSNQNNNNIEARPKGSSLSLQGISTTRHPRHGCFLQAVQEEEETEATTEDFSFSTEPSFTWQDFSRSYNY